MAEQPRMADFLQGRVYSFAPSEFSTPDEMRQERISQALGWDTTRPGMEFLRRLIVSPEAQLGLGVRSPVGARIGNDSVWAARTPSAITGGQPDHFIPSIDHYYAPADASSVGMIGRHPQAFQRNPASVPKHDTSGMMRDVTPAEMGFAGPSAPSNLNRPGSLGWAPFDSIKGPY